MIRNLVKEAVKIIRIIIGVVHQLLQEMLVLLEDQLRQQDLREEVEDDNRITLFIIGLQ